jgi:uncharacterized repeat protein (TIGR03803 family)
MKRFQTGLAATLCCGALSLLAGCDDDHHHGYFPPPPPPPTGDGLNPDALIQGTDGNFYGTTAAGGAHGWGTVFKVTAAGTETLLYSFTGGNDGATPQSLVEGSDGNFYGTNANGGSSACQQGCGTVFKITPAGVLTSLYVFTGAADGANPVSLIQGSDGNFYGTAAYGGVINNSCGYAGCGVLFKVTPAGAESALYSFTATGSDGGLPVGVLQGTDGNFYGTTTFGGTGGNGTVFKVTPAGVETVLHSFAGSSDGAEPQAGLVQASDGNLYGTTQFGGTDSDGIVFKITTAGVETVLYAFTGTTTDGANPATPLIAASDGNLYGTTGSGGNAGCRGGCGTVFKISTAGVEAALYVFTAGGGQSQHGPDPTALLQGSDGNFYGTTAYGGAAGCGAVFKITPAGVGTVLYSFNGTGL